VLYPDAYTFRPEELKITYRLDVGSAWNQVNPKAELERVIPNVERRVRRLYDYLPKGKAVAATHREAHTRRQAILMVLIAGPLLFVVFLLIEYFIFGGSLNPQKVGDILGAITPEVVHGQMKKGYATTSFEQLLARMAGEGKLAIELLPPNAAKEPSEVELKLLAPREQLPKYERAVIDIIFDSDEKSTTSHRARDKFRQTEQYPDRRWRELILQAGTADPSGVGLASVPLILFGVWAGYKQVIGLSRDEEVIAIVLVNVAALVITFLWPKQWWHSGLPKRGLFLHLIVLILLYGALHLAINRPYPADVWTYSAVSILAYFVAQLVSARAPALGAMNRQRDVSQVRHYAIGELHKPAPNLDDRWIYHLVAMGLAPDIERWSNAHPDALHSGSSASENQFNRPICSSPFTGLPPEPWPGPPGWAEVFEVSSAELDEDEDWDEEDEFDNDELDDERDDDKKA
jgi:hypothetical protein